MTPSVTPSNSLQTALADVKGAFAALTVGSPLTPEDQTRINYALQALEPVVADELNAVASAYLSRMPVFGGIADAVVKGAINQALEDGLAQLTAAKAGIGG